MEIKFLLFIITFIANCQNVLSVATAETETKKQSYSEILNKEFVNNERNLTE